MSSVQVHHEKLWYAGKSGNWDLAEFELHEMREAFEGVRTFGDDTVAIQVLPMIDSALTDVEHSVKAADKVQFASSFTRLTTDCNNCHRATNHPYMVITSPATPPFSNQVFEKMAQ